MAALAEAREGVLLRPGRAGWRPLADERLDRRVIRLALYLSDIFEIEPGDRVAIASELRQAWLLADLAIMSLGAVSVAVEPHLPAEILHRALGEAAPRLLFASASVLRKLRPVHGHVGPLIPVLAFDGTVRWDGPVPLTAALEVWSALDGPGPTKSLRKTAWEIEPQAPACGHFVGIQDGHVECVELSPAEALEQVMTHWSWPRARAGERVYFAGPEVTLRTRMALYAALGDGLSSIVFGSPGREFEELADLQPGKIVGPPSLFAQAARLGQTGPSPRMRGLGAWVGGVLHGTTLGRARAEGVGLLTALGGRARWVAPTEPLEPDLAERLRAVAVIGPSAGSHSGSVWPA
jgi:AMP-binding enzyme